MAAYLCVAPTCSRDPCAWLPTCAFLLQCSVCMAADLCVSSTLIHAHGRLLVRCFLPDPCAWLPTSTFLLSLHMGCTMALREHTVCSMLCCLARNYTHDSFFFFGEERVTRSGSSDSTKARTGRTKQPSSTKANALQTTKPVTSSIKTKGRGKGDPLNGLTAQSKAANNSTTTAPGSTHCQEKKGQAQPT